MFLSWIPPLSFTLFIFLTLSSVSQWWTAIFSTYPSSTLKKVGGTLFALLFLWALLTLFFRRRTGKTVSFFWFFGISFSYAVLLYSLENMVEQAHIVEYGILTFLYHFPVRKIVEGHLAFYGTWLITFSVGIVDEWIQFYLPTRVGVLPDIYLNAVSAALPLLFLAKVMGERSTAPMTSRGIRISGSLTIFFLLLFGGFVATVTDQGYRHVDPEIGAFYSRFSLENLKRKDQQEGEKYAAMVKDLYPVKMHTYLKNQKAVDKYAMEILVHLFRRDEHEKKGSLWVASMENRILAGYFNKAITLSGYAWTQKKESAVVDQLKNPKTAFYESPVSKDEIIVSFPPAIQWGIIGLLICGLTVFMLKNYSATRHQDTQKA